jgi:diaminopropionate ammonia-lyase
MDRWMLFNERWRRNTLYPLGLRVVLDLQDSEQAAAEIATWPGYTPTPLRSLAGLAGACGVDSVLYKDEAARFAVEGLGSFKALGAPYALAVALRHRVEEATGIDVDAAGLIRGEYAHLTGALTAVCATDGNHGRALAWAAQRFGCACVIYVHADVSVGRRQAIARYGARIVEVSGTYDDAVRSTARVARANGWLEISDTAYEGYSEIPRCVMHGYSVMVREALEQMEGRQPPTHVFVQCGVGGLAAAVVGHLWQRFGAKCPRVVLVEPETAACAWASAVGRNPVSVAGGLETIMAGLACGTLSTLAWEVLADGAAAFVRITDEAAVEAMRLLADGTHGDTPLVGGESGVAGLGGFLAVARDPRAARLLGLSACSRVLLFGSEGASDPEIYTRYVGSPPDRVATRSAG